MQTNVIINYTKISDGKKASKTLTYVRPTATSQKLLELAQAINALTTNTFTLATKETKGEVL